LLTLREVDPWRTDDLCAGHPAVVIDCVIAEHLEILRDGASALALSNVKSQSVANAVTLRAARPRSQLASFGNLQSTEVTARVTTYNCIGGMLVGSPCLVQADIPPRALAEWLASLLRLHRR